MDVKPSNISFGTYDSTNANPSSYGLYRTVPAGFSAVTSITPANTGAVVIGTYNAASSSASSAPS